MLLEIDSTLYHMFKNCLDKFGKAREIALDYDPVLTKNIIDAVAKEIRQHYPNIPGTSGVKWAGHLCSAIHHQRPILMKDMHRNNSAKYEFFLNAEFALIIAIEIIQRSYLGKINHNKEIKLRKSAVFDPRPEFYELIRSTLNTHLYTTGNTNSKINPMILAMFFEAFLEGRYPDVIKEGSNW